MSVHEAKPDIPDLTNNQINFGNNIGFVKECELSGRPIDFWDADNASVNETSFEIPKSNNSRIESHSTENIGCKHKALIDENCLKASESTYNATKFNKIGKFVNAIGPETHDNDLTTIYECTVEGFRQICDALEAEISVEAPKLSNTQLNISIESYNDIEDLDCNNRKSLIAENSLKDSESSDNLTKFNKDVEFVREIEIESCNIDLKLSQFAVGDVGCVVWDAGIALGKYLDYSQKLNTYAVAGKSAVDIGSGTGIVGLCAAALGANVVLTDLPGFIPQIEKNIGYNKDVLNGSASAMALSWGEQIENLPSPDIIFVSDCIYYDMSVTKLIPTLVQLSSENTDIFISYEDRDTESKKKVLSKFLKELLRYFEVDIIPKSQQHPDYYSDDIYLLKCRSVAKERM